MTHIPGCLSPSCLAFAPHRFSYLCKGSLKGWKQSGGQYWEKLIFPETVRFPQSKASWGLRDCEKVSTGNESQQQLGPFTRHGPGRLLKLGPQ